MRTRSLITLLLFVMLPGLSVLYATRPSTLSPALFQPRQANLANGQTMFNIGGCTGCHARPKQDDRLTLGGGLALKSPFGTFKVPNISTDPKAGIGAWTELEFANAMLKGVGRNNEHLFPSFPYTSYRRMLLNDVRDLYAFLQTLPPDTTPSEPHQLPFPFNIRSSIGIWKLLFLDAEALTPDPAKDADYNRGAYLIEGPGHCAECHSTRNILGAIEQSTRFAGGVVPGEGWAPNITPHPDGLAGWSRRDIELFLHTGLTPDGYAVIDSMAAVIRNTSRLSDADRRAMAAYLMTLPLRPGAKPKKE